MLQNELKVMRRRKVPETDPRIVAIKRTLQSQEPEPVRRGTNNIPFSHMQSQNRRVK